MAGQTLHGGFELPLEQGNDDGLVQQLVFAPGQVGCCLIIQVVVFLLLVPLPVIRLTPQREKCWYTTTDAALGLMADA